MHCAKTAEGIKIKLGVKVGRGKCNIVLGGGPDPSRGRGVRGNMLPLKPINAYICKTDEGIEMKLGRKVGCGRHSTA